jgi:serine/threonine-protein kinase RsbW
MEDRITESAGLAGDRATRRQDDLDVTVPADVRYLPLLRETAHAFALQRGAPDPEDIRLAISEACTNVVLHAYAPGRHGTVRVHGTCENGHIVLTVEDRGAGLRPSHNVLASGLGLPIIAALADRWAVQSSDGGGTQVRMAFARRTPAHAGGPREDDFERAVALSRREVARALDSGRDLAELENELR